MRRRSVVVELDVLGERGVLVVGRAGERQVVRQPTTVGREPASAPGRIGVSVRGDPGTDLRRGDRAWTVGRGLAARRVPARRSRRATAARRSSAAARRSRSPRSTGRPVASSTSRRVCVPSMRDSTKYSSGPTAALSGSKPGLTRSFCCGRPDPGDLGRHACSRRNSITPRRAHDVLENRLCRRGVGSRPAPRPASAVRRARRR